MIVESFDAKDDNADDMVVMEAPQDPMKLQDIDKIDSQFSQEHGHLVAQILETQKELINTESADVLPKKVEIVRNCTVFYKFLNLNFRIDFFNFTNKMLVVIVFINFCPGMGSWIEKRQRKYGERN